MSSLHAKSDKLEEISQFPNKHKLPQLTQCELDNLKSPINSKEIDFKILSLPKKTSAGPHSFTGELYQTLK